VTDRDAAGGPEAGGRPDAAGRPEARGGSDAGGGEVDRRPNVLFVITDQQRADHVGFMGNEVVRTPNLDALAARATVFENAWVSNPVCMPNRSTIMTGRLPTAHGVIFNDRSLDWGANTFVRQFRAAGYRTALIGKSHLQHGMSRNAVVAHRGQPAVASPYPQGWDELEEYERYLSLDQPAPDPDDFYGFDHIELAIDHGARVTGHHLRWALDRGGRPEDLVVPYGPEAPGRDRSDEWWQVYRPPYGAELHSSSFVAERTLAFVAEATGQERPWLAWASFPDPHHPMTPPGEYFDRHRPQDMAVPATIDDPLDDAPAHLRRIRSVHPRDQRGWVGVCGAGSPRLVQEAVAATYGMIEMVDDCVGRILAGVAESARRSGRDTIVVFTSDHGDMMGDHGLLLKGFMHYRGTLQVPLAIAAPGRAPARTSSLASSIDLGPTLLELCGLGGYDGIQGRSLVPLLDDPAATVRDHVLIEDDVAPITARLAGFPAKTRTLVTENWRYTRNSTREEQLFDLRADPDERNDLRRDRPELRAEATARMMDALIDADDAARGAPHAEPVPTGW